MSPAPAAQAPVSVSLFDLNADAPVLQGLSLVSHVPGEVLVQALRTSGPGPEERVNPERKPLEISDKLFCSTCQQSFQNHQEQREHYKLDWHRFNLKQRLKDKPFLSALDFERQSSAGELSSISGSEDSDDSTSDEDDQTLAEEKVEHEKPGRPQGFQPHQLLFQNAQGQFLSAYRCVLGPRKAPPEEAEMLLQNLQSGTARTCVVLMAAAGHFAGAIFQGREVVTHKTFHRYTVRAKRGTAQSVQDARGGACRSAGASLRRHNEAALYQDVRNLLAGPVWAKALGEAGTVLLRAPRSGRSLFFGGHRAPLQRGDPRLWDIPLTTRRPTFRELQRVLHKLTTLLIHGEDPRESAGSEGTQRHWKAAVERKKDVQGESQVPGDSNMAPQQHREDSAEPGSGSEGEDDCPVELELVELTLGTLGLREFEVLPKRRRRRRNKKERSRDVEAGTPHLPLPPHDMDMGSQPAPAPVATGQGPPLEDAKSPGQPERWAELLAACRAGDIGVLRPQLTASPMDPEVLSLLNTPLGPGGFTLLHAAAAAGRGAVIRLLLEAGADPTMLDSQARPPYVVAADKSTRSEFRRFMEQQPDAHDYGKAQVPGPLSAAMEARRAARKKEQRAARRQREQQQRQQQEQERREQEERERFAALSDREKRALAAERRLAAQLGTPSPAVPESTVNNVRRCQSCGASLQGLVPFHYLDFSFCSTRCLREHRGRAAAS